METVASGRAKRRTAVVALALLVLSLGLGFPPELVRASVSAPTLGGAGGRAVAGLRREAHRLWLAGWQGWELARLPSYYASAEAGCCRVYFPRGREDEARAVLAQAREHVRALESDLGYRLPDKLTIVISPDRRRMSATLWGGRADNALGAYWRGVLWVLAPGAWLDTKQSGWQEEFAVEGPVVHELSHRLLDGASAGNVPAWFDEGVAQYEEFKHTGFEWVEPANRLNQRLYSIEELGERFNELPNEALAYREAFLLVRYMVEARGEGVLRQVAGDLGRGLGPGQAIAGATGMGLDELEASWRAWLQNPSRNGRVSSEIEE